MNTDVRGEDGDWRLEIGDWKLEKVDKEKVEKGKKGRPSLSDAPFSPVTLFPFSLSIFVSHIAVLLLLVISLLIGRLWDTRRLAVSTRLPVQGLPAPARAAAGGSAGQAGTQTGPGQAFTQRVLLFAPQNPIPDVGTDQGYVRRRIPPVTVDTQDVLAAPAPPSDVGRGGSMLIGAGFVTRGIDPEGSAVPIARTEVITYAVREGDTLWDIAGKFNITQDTLWANNDLSSPDLLSVGDELVIPPVDGLIYTVRSGDTLEKLAQRYRTDVEEIVNYALNDLGDGQSLAVGQQIIIPGGVKPIPARRTVSLTKAPAGALKGDGSFVMPISGVLTQGFRAGHPAIDVGAPKGAPIYAADAGYVTFAGWHPLGYGYAVEIDHGNGFRTLYAHMSWYAPDTGQSVKQGELIGGAGSTYGSGGYSTGPHLHLEVIQKGAKRNPCLFVACP